MLAIILGENRGMMQTFSWLLTLGVVYGCLFILQQTQHYYLGAELNGISKATDALMQKYPGEM